MSRDVAPNEALYAEVLQFLYHEAELLDSRRFEDWLALMAEDISYRMPVRVNRMGQDKPTFTHEMEIMSENYASLRLRIMRLGTDFAWAETPPSRTRHLVSNVRVRSTSTVDEYEVRSYVLVYRSRSTSPHADIFSGERQDLLRRVDGEWRVAKRTILLDQAVIGARNLSIFF